MRDGHVDIGYGLTESRRFTIAPPGRIPLGERRFSLCDAPDLKVLPALWPSLRDTWMGAGTVPEIMHRVLNLAAWAVQMRVLPSLLPFGKLMHWASNRLRWGEHRGGMYVEVKGQGGGRQAGRTYLAHDCRG